MEVAVAKRIYIGKKTLTPCVPDRPYKILLVQVGTLSFSHASFGVPVLFIYLDLRTYTSVIL